MGLRFFRRVKILPGVYINLGKRGASVSVGPRGAKVNFGAGGVKASVGIPGTGIRYEQRLTGTGPRNAVGITPKGGGATSMTPTSVNGRIGASGRPSGKAIMLPPGIASLVKAIKQARLYSLMISIAAWLVFLTVVTRCVRLMTAGLKLDFVVSFGVVVLVAIFVMRLIARLKLKIPMMKLVPGKDDHAAQAMFIAFRSSRVWYDTRRSVGSSSASMSVALPFPLKRAQGIFAYKLGGAYLVPLRGFVVVVDGLKVWAVPNDRIRLSVFKSSKTGSGYSPNPPDSQIIGRQWLHTTKAGLPDRRYNYNPCETSYQVGVLGMEAASGFEYWITFSRSSSIERMAGIVGQNNSLLTHEETRPIRVRSTVGADYFSMIRKSSTDIVRFLERIESDARCKKMLDDIGGVEVFDSLGKYCRFNPRLAMIAYTDLRDTFRRLGYSTDDLTGLEGLGMMMVMLGLFDLDADIDRLEDPQYSSQMAGIASRCIREVGGDMNIKGEDTPLMLHFVFSHSSGVFDWAVEYATLVYRWASIMAKADGTITPDEEKALTRLMKLKEETSGANVRISGGVDTTKAPAGFRPAQKRHLSNTGSRQRSPAEMFNGLIGLKPVREEVEKLASFVEIQRLRESKGMKVAPISYHCVFTGNPGTGKTTVARIVAEIYRNLGVLKKGHLVETDRSGLVAEYVGQTAVKTNKVIDSALDGVLFIDEAYSLVGGGKEDYGMEAVATLLKRMEDDRSRLVVILAGYTAEIRQFIDSNPGLHSRFNRYIDFPDYSADELLQIFVSLAKKSQYRLDPQAEESLREVMAEAFANKDKNFGNARFVRNLFEKSIERQAFRLASVSPITQEMLEFISAEDILGKQAVNEEVEG